MSDGFGYLVNYPDGSQTVDHVLGQLVLPGSEILPLWKVTRVSVVQPEQLLDGLLVAFEVWVKPVLREDPTDELLG
jgi:hypothetical protein